MLVLQEFPHIAGLQDPTVHNSLFPNSQRIVQIIFVGGCHWCTVSNIGWDDGVVNVYNSMYSSASSGTIKLIASLLFSPAEQFIVRMMDVGRQSNGSDCGVLSIAFAYDICSGKDPCKIKYDHRSIRQHLADCLEKCCLLTSLRLVSAGLLVSGTRSQWTFTVPAACQKKKAIKWPSVTCTRHGATSTA